MANAKLNDLVSPDRMLTQRLVLQPLELHLGEDLIEIADPDYSIDGNSELGMLLPKLAALRQRICDETGYTIPLVRIMDSENIPLNEVQIFVRGNFKIKFYVYPKHVLIKERISNLQDIVEETYEIFNKPVYWVNNTDLSNDTDYEKFNSNDIILQNLKYICIKCIDEIIQIDDIIKRIGLFEDVTKKEYLKNNANILRKIFINLIREEISVFDYRRIFDLTCEYDKKSADFISEKIREDITFKTQITNKYEKNNEIEAIELTNELFEFINQSLTSKQEKEIVERFKKIEERLWTYPIVCDKEIRLKLFRILKDFFSRVNVIAYSELLPNVKIKHITVVN
ncbi:MAG: FHIPEP family type III secretion protein [Candidatus Gastranaerophilales bacterium]|nr:FHIPEP family type III secretion protein [Candidatus Gastranaerophilales bacterium]